MTDPIETIRQALGPMASRGTALKVAKALEAEGWKLTGPEATESMLANGREAMLPIVPHKRLTTYGPVQGVWSDMFAAAPTFGDSHE